MKNIFTYFALCLFSWSSAQIPSGYYNGTSGLEKAALKTKLSQIISDGHQDRGYDALYTAYATSDIDKYYENDGSLLDMYSENPNGSDPYNFRLGTKQCGNYKNEGDCYNREHSIPQSSFSKAKPMVSDGHHIVPTDGKVNGMRSSYPFGEVKSTTWTSLNGSKLGSSSINGYSGTVFEPIDEFKGDFARIIFYFVTRYESRLSGFTFSMFSKNTYPSLSSWTIPMLLKWHREDPVSPREIDRNNALYKFQGNRNPFIDDPNFAEKIWGDSDIITPGDPDDKEAPTTPTNLTAENITSTSVLLIWNESIDNNELVSYNVYANGVLLKNISVNSVNESSEEDTFGSLITGLKPETTYTFQITALDASKNESEKSNEFTITTPKAEPGTIGSCGIEDFEKANDIKSSYNTVNFTNNNITWTATEARTDQNITNKAITIRRLGTLKSSSISGGIGSLTLSFKNSFTNNDSTLKIKVIGETQTKEYSFSVTQKLQTETVVVNLDENFTFEFSVADGTASNDKRITIDDVKWDCYTLSTEDINKKVNKLVVYPNPIKNQEFIISGLKNVENIYVYNSSAQLVQTFNNVQNNQKLLLNKLPKGVYVLKSSQTSTKVIVD